ncbi:MAG: hypothetical protein GXY58_08105 [Planctomycetaceae bacterium]|nr:hypothetical protein [Planctomycetaceae bacterium]
MALTHFAKDCLKRGVANNQAGANLATVIDAGTGTITQPSKEALCVAVGNHAIGYGLATKFAADTELAHSETWRLAQMLGSYTAALAIKAEQED